MRKKLTLAGIVDRQKKRVALITHQRAIHEAAKRQQYRSEYQRVQGIFAATPIGLRENVFLRDRQSELKGLFRESLETVPQIYAY